jgi:glycosyltransferase involved in cell wall biosynthesis
LAVVEAMACGLAPVVSRVPGPTRIIRDGHDALLVPPADAGAIVLAIERLATQPALLERLRRNAHTTAQSYGWHEVAAEQLAIYQSHLAKTGLRTGQ